MRMKDIITHIINVRKSGDSFIARGSGKSASCTSHASYAVERVAMKLKGLPTSCKDPKYVPFEQTGITIRQSTSQTYLIEWEAA